MNRSRFTLWFQSAPFNPDSQLGIPSYLSLNGTFACSTSVEKLSLDLSYMLTLFTVVHSSCFSRTIWSATRIELLRVSLIYFKVGDGEYKLCKTMLRWLR